MENFMDTVKRYPGWIAGGVLALVVLIYLMSRGSSSGATGIVAYGPSDTVVVAGAQTEAARIAANAATAQAQLALEALQDSNETEITLNAQNTATAAAIVGSNNAATITINEQNTKAATDINAAQVAGTVTMAQSHDTTEITLANINAWTENANMNAQVWLRDAEMNIEAWKSGVARV
jgi:hypothetical protein